MFSQGMCWSPGERTGSGHSWCNQKTVGEEILSPRGTNWTPLDTTCLFCLGELDREESALISFWVGELKASANLDFASDQRKRKAGRQTLCHCYWKKKTLKALMLHGWVEGWQRRRMPSAWDQGAHAWLCKTVISCSTGVPMEDAGDWS